MIYRLIDSRTLQPVSPKIRREQFPNIGLPSISTTLRPGQGFLTYVPESDLPDFDPLTHRLEREITLTSYGWQIIPLTPEEIAARIPEVIGVTPLVIIERLVAAGKWEIFETVLGNFPSYVEKSFYAATDIKVNHPLFLQYGASFKTPLQMTDSEFDALLTP